MQFGISNKKAGVSLVTVLLFMLVATIAATATYKWLTSEGRSSASRMLQQEAYQSSVAGIENARTWMTFHANDVGALVKAYLDGGRKPINLDARLRPLQKAGQNYHVWLTGVNTEKSTYKLKIMSAGESRNDTRHSETAIFNVDGLYQVKVPHEKVTTSIPFEHNYFGGSTQSQGTIKAHSLLINGNLHGSNPVYTDADLVVTGDINITGSSVGAGGTVCVGGNLNANNGVLGNDFYVVGDASSFTFPTTSEAAHLTNANVTGNVYIGGDLNAPTTGKQQFQKNLTLMGKWKTNLGAQESSVAGNLCLGPNAQVEISSTGRTFHVDGNVWSEPNYPVWWTGHGELNHDKYNKIILGNKAESKVYISTAHPSSEYVTLRSNRAFVESRYYYRGTAGGMGSLTWDARTHYPYQNVPAADDKYYLYKYTGPGQDVDFVVSTQWTMWGYVSYANYYVENQVFYTPAGFGFMPGPGGLTGTNHTLNMGADNKPTGSPYCKAMADKWRPECKVTPWFKSMGTVDNTFTAEDKNFECAESVKDHCDAIWEPVTDGCDDSKYKVNDILVTAFTKFEEFANKGCTNVTRWDNEISKKLNACYEYNSSDATRAQTNLYNGYQVVKVEDGQKSDPRTPLKGKFIIIVTNSMGQQSLPPTTADSYAFVYLTQGATRGEGSIQPANDNGIYNYFIYTKDNIKQVMFNNADFNGSIYAAVYPNCAKVGNFKSRNMIYNDALMKDLATNGVVCEAASATEASCGGVGGGTTEPVSSSSGSLTGGTDAYYISMAPQLGVRLESQSKSDESLPSANETTELTPSFIVLPRVIYLPSDPYGKLTDYYSVQALNGSALMKSDVSVTCSGPGALNTTTTMYDGTGLLAKGIYTCTASTSVANHASIPFWVVIGDGTRGIPPVSFTETSHQMDPTEQKEVQITVPVRATALDIEIYCPAPDNEGWSYLSFGTGVTRNEATSTCNVHVESGAAATLTIFTIKTQNASFGTMSFQIMPGEGYIPGMYATTQLFIASSAILDRQDITLEQQKVYCDANPSDCPADTTGWPDCSAGGIWVEPSGTSYSKLTDNNSWMIMIGNSQEVTLTKPENFDDCVVIIPTTGNSIPVGGVVANQTYTLSATAKAKSNTFKVGFAGDVGSGNNPTVTVTVGSRSTTCEFDNAVVEEGTTVKTCTIAVFDGESVSLELAEAGSGEFNYWDCTGASCPTTSSIVSTRKYDAFTVSDNATTVLAHFGEKDNHCFFDEFKNTGVECDEGTGGETKNCIDKCGKDDVYSTCASAEAVGDYTNAKWHLISGYISQIVVGPDGEIHIDKSVNKGKKESERTAVKVLSTVKAGVLGTLKALVNVPRATSSYDKSAANIKNSGFMLRANTYGNDAFMLNLYENSSGQLEAQLWRGNTSLSLLLANSNDVPASVSGNSSMVMATMTVKTDSIYVSAIIDGFYGQDPTVYGCAFDLTDFNNTLADMAHEFVGYSLADPSFKIYGIGWMSDTYNAQCHDTYPTVKCSFAAVANDGVIKTKTETSDPVKPWVGYSGWFEAKNCSPIYYYYNGNDASATCSGSPATCIGGYKFDESGKGLHGYTDANGVEQKTAKAWLGNCLNASNADVAWGVEAVNRQAHCGTFWTGKYDECTAHQELFSGSTSASDGTDATITLNTIQNLRAATLQITLENPDRNEVEIWLISQDDEYWGSEGHESRSVKMTGNSASFDVVRDFAAGENGSFAGGVTNGFDPEHVKYVVVRNHGETSVNVTKIASTCANAIGITNCRAEYNGTSWDVMTQVTNKDMIVSYQVVATVDNSQVFSDSKTSEEIVWNGNIASLQHTDNPYDSYQGKSYVFVATVNGSATGQTDSKNCSVSPDPIGAAEVNCSVIGTVASGARFPTFNVNFNGCPGAGCAYEVYIDGEKFAEGTEKTTARHSANQSEVCTSAEGCTHTYKVQSPAGAAIPFSSCEASFKVVRNAEDVPPSVRCGISTNEYGFTNDPISVTDNLYFLAQNNESVDKTFSVVLKNGDDQVGTASLKNWSQITNVKNLGSLTAGNHTYSLYYNGEKVCDADVTVNESSGACTITGNLYQGQQLAMTVSGVKSNTQFTWTLDDDSRTIDCGTSNCWNNTLNAPDEAGTYSYSVKKGTNTICTGSVTIASILTCSVSPTTVNKGANYTFTANGALHCWNCTYTNDAGTATNNLEVQAGGTLTRTNAAGNSTGEKSLTFACNSCDNNVSASCSVPLTIAKTKPVFDCATNLKAAVNTDNNVKLKLSGIAGCDGDGCSYRISGTGSTATTYTGCTNTSCGISPITNKNKSNGDTAIYVVSLENSEGTTTHNCSVEFTSSPVCGCTCSDCSNIIVGTNVGFEGTNSSVVCAFGTSVVTVNRNYDKYDIKVNGTMAPYCDGNGDDKCATKIPNAGISTIDGGYYMEIGVSSEWIKGTVTGATVDPCAGETPPNTSSSATPVETSSSATPATSSSATPASSNSVVPMVITNGQYPSQVNNVASGTCFSLSGVWNNDCNRHPNLNCNVTSGGAGIKFTYGTNVWSTQNYNLKQDLGVAMSCSPNSQVFISSVCVEWLSSGATGWCKFEN